jgi:rhamnogalacturonyl hydrolase YesR
MNTLKYFSLITALVTVSIFAGCAQQSEPAMSPEEFARHVSDVIVNGTEFHFEPAVQEFEQDGVFMIEFPAGDRGVYYARSVITVEGIEGYDFEPQFALTYPAGAIKVQLNGETIYAESSNSAGHFDNIDYGLFEYEDRFSVDLSNGEQQLAIKFAPRNTDAPNRIYFNVVRSDNGLSHPAVEAQAPSTEEELAGYGYWWVGPVQDGDDEIVFMNPLLSPQQLITAEFTSVNGESVRWDLPKKHLVKSLPGWLTYQNWHYSGGTFLDAMNNVSNEFSSLDYSDYINQHMDFLLNNIEDIEEMRDDYGLIESPFGHYFRFSLLDDMGMQTVPYVNRLIAQDQIDRDSDEYKLANRVTDYIMNDASRMPDGTFARFTPDTMSVWADDLFMASIVLLKMHELTGEAKYLDEVVDQVIKFDGYLLDEPSNIYWHGYFSEHGEHSSTKWGRANGWTMMAKTELLLAMPDDHPQKEQIMEIFTRHSEGLLAVQSDDGRWHQVLDDPSTYLETSATAMFVRAFATGVNEGWLDRGTYDEAINKGWASLTHQINEDGDVVGIVRGTPIFFSDEEYANWGTRRSDPRGLGALLYAAISVERYQQGAGD